MGIEYMPNAGLPMNFFFLNPIQIHQTNPDLNRKFLQLDKNLGESFYYLPYLDICKSEKVLVNIYCKFAYELLCS